jgi:hypothetical protein
LQLATKQRMSHHELVHFFTISPYGGQHYGVSN